MLQDLRPCYHPKSRYLMRKVDHRSLWRYPEHHSLAQPDEIVAEPVVGEKADGTRTAHALSIERIIAQRLWSCSGHCEDLGMNPIFRTTPIANLWLLERTPPRIPPAIDIPGSSAVAFSCRSPLPTPGQLFPAPERLDERAPPVLAAHVYD